MFCPTCVRSYPEDSEKCPKCQGPLTNVIEIFADDEPPRESYSEVAPPPITEEPIAEPETPVADVAVAIEGFEDREPPPLAPPLSSDEELRAAKAAFGTSTPNLWVASTVLCTILLLVVVFFDSSSSRSKPKPQVSPTSPSEQLQAREDAPPKQTAPESVPQGPTSEELRTQADALLLQAKRSRQSGDLEGAEQQAEEAYRLHSEIDDNNHDIAYSLEELAIIHVEMDELVQARSELNKAQRLVYSSERKQLLANLTSPRATSASGSKENAPTTPGRRPSLGEASSVPQAAPRVSQSTTAEEKRVARPRMKEIEAYKPDDQEQTDVDVPLGQQDVVESYRGTRKGSKNKIPGLR
jgi:hypothetical protein